MERVSVYSPDIFAYITPPYPFVHVQFVNDIPESVSDWTSDFSSNIVPFPEIRVMLTNDVWEKERFGLRVFVMEREKRDAFRVTHVIFTSVEVNPPLPTDMRVSAAVVDEGREEYITI